GWARALRGARHGGAGADAAREVAGFALSIAGGVAADAVDAAPARALVGDGAIRPVGELGLADAARAPIAGGAVRVLGAVAVAGGRAAQVGVADLRLQGRAAAAAVAARAQGGGARGAGRVAAGDRRVGA